MSPKRKPRQMEIDLNQAILAGRVNEVSRLLEGGVDPNAFDDKSLNSRLAFTALCNAISAAAHTVSRERALIDEAIQELCPGTPGADLKTERARSLKIIRLLLSAGADPNLRTHTRTPLSLAVHRGDKKVAQLLLDAGASPSGECWSLLPELPRRRWALAFHRNAIHEAAEKGLADIVKILCARGADVSAHDHSGKTALQIARKWQHSEIIRILEQYEQPPM